VLHTRVTTIDEKQHIVASQPLLHLSSHHQHFHAEIQTMFLMLYFYCWLIWIFLIFFHAGTV
jgi:hypothetical protein